MSGEYISIAAEINNSLETFYYIKAGTTRGYAYDRCDAQRLKLVGTTRNGVVDDNTRYYPMEKDLHNHIMSMGYKRAPIDYSAAGYTESFGKFDSPLEALVHALTILETFNITFQGSTNEKWTDPIAKKLAYG